MHFEVPGCSKALINRHGTPPMASIHISDDKNTFYESEKILYGWSFFFSRFDNIFQLVVQLVSHDDQGELPKKNEKKSQSKIKIWSHGLYNRF